MERLDWLHGLIRMYWNGLRAGRKESGPTLKESLGRNVGARC